MSAQGATLGTKGPRSHIAPTGRPYEIVGDITLMELRATPLGLSFLTGPLTPGLHPGLT